MMRKYVSDIFMSHSLRGSGYEMQSQRGWDTTASRLGGSRRVCKRQGIHANLHPDSFSSC